MRSDRKMLSSAGPVHRQCPRVVAELAELVDDLVGRIARQLGAPVVDLLDVRLRARRAHDVLGRAHPLAEPVEALPAHALRQHGDAATAQNLRDGHAAAAVVARRGPHRALPRRVEAPRHQARRQAGVGRQHLVRADHREQGAERHDDARLHAGQRLGELDVHGGGDLGRALQVVEPVHAIEVERVGIVGADLAERGTHVLRDQRRLRQLGEGRQPHALRLQQRQGAGADLGVLDFRRKIERTGVGALPHGTRSRPRRVFLLSHS